MAARPARRRTTSPNPASGGREPRAVQLALFPEAVDVRPLDPHAVAGPRTRVRGIWLVRYPHDRDPAPHRVFANRRGWYCEAHGARCRAVDAARSSADARAGAAR